jgi:hypothetical protein
MVIIITGIAIIILSGIVYLILDYFGPESIQLEQDIKFGMPCLRARDLIVQEFDSKGNLWATRGLIIYCLKNGDTIFKKAARVPSGFSFLWLNNFSIFRRYTIRSECIEMTINEAGHICAFSSGRMWNSRDCGKKFHRTLNLNHYGIGIGRGIMSTGLLKIKERDFLFGEYFSNSERQNVKILKYTDDIMTWDPVYIFHPGQIRHIHALQADPYTGKLWICTGDEDSEAMIGWSEDNFNTLVPIGIGSQKWRTCQLVFTEEAIYWGADTGSEDFAGIYKWEKQSQKLNRLQSIDGAIFYGTRLANGTIIMSTDREGFPNEKDEKTRLLIINEDNKITTIDCGTWKIKKPGFRFNFAKLRFQRTQGNNLLAISCLNQKEIPDGDLLIYSEEVFY